MGDELSGNIVAELSKREKNGTFIGEGMQSKLEGMWNKVEYALKD